MSAKFPCFFETCSFQMTKVHIFWEGHKILQNLHHRFDRYNIGQVYGGDFVKIWGLLRIYELYWFLYLFLHNLWFFFSLSHPLDFGCLYMVLFSQIAKLFKENIFISNSSPTFVYRRVSRSLRYDRVLHWSKNNRTSHLPSTVISTPCPKIVRIGIHTRVHLLLEFQIGKTN